MPTKPTNKALVAEIRSSLPADLVWDEREQALLSLAEKQAADLDLWRPTSRSRGSGSTATGSTRPSAKPGRQGPP
jgi:hypothetical protein